MGNFVEKLLQFLGFKKPVLATVPVREKRY